MFSSISPTIAALCTFRSLKASQLWHVLPAGDSAGGCSWRNGLAGVFEGPMLLRSVQHPGRVLPVVLWELFAKSLPAWQSLEDSAAGAPVLRHQVRLQTW